ncbi:MAG: hypothetical protein LBJ31_05985 [Treponema sp.]|jgi:ABC-type transporter MlaC component|nr:hypothetical protein [Treponema sp.]
MKKLMVSLAMITLLTTRAAPQTGNAAAVKVLEEYLHRIGQGNLTNIESLATAQGAEIAHSYYRWITAWDKQKLEDLKTCKVTVFEESIDNDRVTFIISYPIKDGNRNESVRTRAELVNIRGTWKVDYYKI